MTTISIPTEDFIQNVKAGDFGDCKWSLAYGHMLERYHKKFKVGHNYYSYAHLSEEEHGGVDNYIQYLAQDINKNGIQNPPEIARYNNGVCLVDGHHRAMAMIWLGWTEIPVKNYDDIDNSFGGSNE